MQIGANAGDEFVKLRYYRGNLFVLGKDLRAKTPRVDGKYSKGGVLVTGKGCSTALGNEKPMGE